MVFLRNLSQLFLHAADMLEEFGRFLLYAFATIQFVQYLLTSS